MLFGCILETLRRKHKERKVAPIKKLVSALLSAAIALSLFGCSQTLQSEGKVTEGTKAEQTESAATSKDDTPLSPLPPETDSPTPPTSDEPEAITYTVPLYQEVGGKVQWEYTYSTDGLSFAKTDLSEEVPITYTVTVDENGAPLHREWTVVVNDTRTEAWRDDYFVDENGVIYEEKRYCEGQIQNAYSYTYGENGEIATQESRNVMQENTTYRLLYDEMGTHVATRYLKYNGESGYYKDETVCTYDEKGRLASETTDSLYTEYTYMEKDGYTVSMKVTCTAGDYTWTYSYNYIYEDGKLSCEEYVYGGEVKSRIYYTQTEFEHYESLEKWIFRERLP